MNFKQMIQEIKEQYPLAKKIEVTYGGSGDSFDNFYTADISEGIGDVDDSFINKYEDLLNAAINATGDSFTNDGSEGNIHIDLVNNKVWAEHFYRVESREHDDDYYVNLDEEEVEELNTA